LTKDERSYLQMILKEHWSQMYADNI